MDDNLEMIAHNLEEICKELKLIRETLQEANDLNGAPH